MNDLLRIISTNDRLKFICVASIFAVSFYLMYLCARKQNEKLKAEIPGRIATLNAVYDNDEAIAGRDKMVVEDFSLMAVARSFKDVGSLTGASTITGAMEFWSCSSQGGLLVVFTCALSVEFGGRAKLVLIDPDGCVKVITENAANAQQDLTEKTLLLSKKGYYRIKLVGQNHPRVNVNLSANKGNFSLDALD